ncbi:MAG: hypothetical protein CVV25_04165 [Ignavibacteriae bacterium HGW-Ignavibacteriae-4]|jgi:hypothetical protein|nr:MAG: hypothetical protein CVV25_04165 [Ignavibacteriae bacterium HGW-Ignavibacteriae-4]
MKKIIIILTAIVFIFSAENSMGISVSRMGGFKSATAEGNSYKFKCGNDNNKKCYTQKDNGETVLGEPTSIFVHSDPVNENNGQGYVNVIFQGYDVIGVPESGINFDTTPSTIEYNNFQDWDNNSSGSN